MTLIDATLPASTALDDSVSGDPVERRRHVLFGWLSANPLVAPAVGIAAGIAVESDLIISLWLSGLLFVISGGLLWRVRKSGPSRHVVMILAGLALGAGLHHAHYRRISSDHVVLYTGQEPVMVHLVGRVMAAPEIRDVQSGQVQAFNQLPRTRLMVAAEQLRGVDRDIPVSGRVAVTVQAPVLQVGAGDRILLIGQLRQQEPPMNPGGRDWAKVYRRRGILAAMTCKRAENIRVMLPAGPADGWMTRLRHRARMAMLEDVYPGEVPGAQLLSALVLGQRSQVDPDLNEAFVRSGTVHYLSVSGAHVGMLAVAVWFLGRLSGQSRRRIALGVALAVTAYGLLAEARAPVWRAVIMADLFCLAIMLGRPVRIANWLALAAIIFLVIQPTQLFEPGFQLSYLTVMSVIFLTPQVYGLGGYIRRRFGRQQDPLLSFHIQRRLGMSRRRMRLHQGWQALSYWLAVAVSAWMVGSLLSAYHFQQFSLWGWLNSLILMPLVGVVLVLGLLKTMVAALLPMLGMGLGIGLGRVTEGLIAIVETLSTWPGAGLRTPAVSGWAVALILLFLSAWILQRPLRLSARWLGVTGMAVLLFAIWNISPPDRQGELRIDLLAVGNGTASVLQLPNGATLLYDIGSMPPFDLERWVVGPFLAHTRIGRIDAVLLSHANIDHYSGLPELLERRDVRQVISTPHFEHLSPAGSISGSVIHESRQRGIPWRHGFRGQRLTGTGEAQVEVLWPPESELEIEEGNDTSMVIKVRYGGKQILICGDIEEYALQRLSDDPAIAADVLILPHHGSVEESTGAFINAVNPQWCIRSSGQRDNHTQNGLIALMQGRQYRNTADHGAIRIVVREGELEVAGYRE